jgi:hypothetical protein
MLRTRVRHISPLVPCRIVDPFCAIAAPGFLLKGAIDEASKR